MYCEAAIYVKTLIISFLFSVEFLYENSCAELRMMTMTIIMMMMMMKEGGGGGDGC